MVGAIEAVVLDRLETSDAQPVYDRANLGLAVSAAAENFHDDWFPRLGLDHKPGIIKEHWARIKALTRRLATGMADEYDSLKPVASLKTELQDQLYLFIQRPVRWYGGEPSDDDKQAIYDALADDITGRIIRLATSRVRQERVPNGGRLTSNAARARRLFERASSARTYSSLRRRYPASSLLQPETNSCTW